MASELGKDLNDELVELEAYREYVNSVEGKYRTVLSISLRYIVSVLNSMIEAIEERKRNKIMQGTSIRP